MNVLIFSTFHLPPHFAAINLEFIQKNLDEGNKVFIVDCHSSFDSCGFNPYKLKYMCEICKYREDKGLTLIKGELTKFSLSEIIKKTHRNAAERFIEQRNKIEKELKYDSLDLGEAVYSSYISKTRQREFTAASDMEVLQRHAFNSIQVYEALKDFIQEKKIEKVGLFNGRWDYYRAALAAARSKNMVVEVFENFRKGGYLEIFGDHLPHNIKNKNRLIEEHWEKSDDEHKYKIADDFFLKKKTGPCGIR